MKKTRYTLASLLILIILFEIVMMMIKGKYYHINEVALLTVLSVALLYKNKMTWGIVLIICLLGIYSLIWIQPKYSSPTIFNFTETIYRPLLGKVNINLIRILTMLPVIFYSFTFILFLTEVVRRQYLNKRGKEIG